MLKTITVIGLLSFFVAFNTYAQDSDRINQLEKENQELKLRVSELESQLSKSGKSVNNWSKLTRGMSTGDVKKILGEPEYESGGIVAYWDYPNGGIVFFNDEKLGAWSEPRQ